MNRCPDLRDPALRALAALLALAGLLIGAVPAQAHMGSTSTGRRVSFQPPAGRGAPALGQAAAHQLVSDASSQSSSSACTSGSAECLVYNGGPVMQTTRLTAIYWQPSGAPAYPTGYVSTVSGFLSDLATASGASTDFFSVLTQYYATTSLSKTFVANNVTAGTPVTDSDPYPSSGSGTCVDPFSTSRTCVTDQGVTSELSTYLASHNLPTGLGNEYVVYFPPGVDTCFDSGGIGDTNCSGTGYCGYHSALSGGTEYANEPDNGDPAYGSGCGMGWVGSTAAAATINTTSHEVSESVTDPELNAWFDSAGNEIGDICAWTFAQGDAPGAYDLPPSSNNTINGDPYVVQTEWDNANGTCSLTTLPTASFSDSTTAGAALTGQSVSFDGSASSTPSGRTITSYQWAFGDGTSASGVSASHAYTAAGTYQVTLTVTDSAGQANTATASVVVTGPTPPTAAFTAPVGAVAGTPTAFDGSGSSAPAGTTITAYQWSFGDGSTATGATAQHTYAAAGTYSVTLTVTDSVGATASVVHSVPVGPASAPTSSGTTTSGGSTGSGGSSGGGTTTGSFAPAPAPSAQAPAPVDLVIPPPDAFSATVASAPAPVHHVKRKHRKHKRKRRARRARRHVRRARRSTARPHR